ncbi:MAG: glycosyltransferase family 4 protein [Pseudoxanthomonas sp.]
MKILLAGPLPEPVNGCSYANAVFRQHCTSAGHSMLVVDTNVPVISGKQGDRFSVRKALNFLRVYRGVSRVALADVVYMTPGQTFFGLLKYAPLMSLARILRKPYVIHVHGNHLGSHYSQLGGIKKRLFRHYVSGAAAGIVLSESLRANFDGLLPPDKVFVVENFAGDAIFGQPATTKTTTRLEVLYLSNLMREKGILILLDAFLLLKQQGVPFRARIAGHLETGISSEIEDRLARLTTEVEYIGPVKGQAKMDLLHEANVFVLPTHYTMEGQPISLLEGMAAGNIIVTTRHAGIPDIVDESNGYLLPVRDTPALAECLGRIAANLPAEIERFSSHNQFVARERFTEQAFVEKILAVLNRVTPASTERVPG